MVTSVADASLVGAMIFFEPRAEEAAALLEGVELYEPVLLGYELASVARKKILKYPERRDVIVESLSVGLTMDMHWIETDHQYTLSLAIETGLTTYDAAYLGLARRLDAPLLTFDERLASASKSAG